MMTPLVATAPASEETAAVSIPMIIEALEKLSPEQWADVFQYILFLHYKPLLLDDLAEEQALWQAVQANQQYDEQHPDEPKVQFASGEEFLLATADW
jgi:hypothetical protein